MSFLDPKHLIDTFGAAGLILIIFIESGILPVPLPGDSLLFMAGFFASTKVGGDSPHLNLGVVVFGTLVAAVLGAQIGYWLGARFGDKLFKPDAKLFKTKYLVQASEYFDRRGARSVVIARFIPVLRTIIPMVAGTTKMSAKSFAAANAIGALFWATGISLLGYFGGKGLANRLGGPDKIDKYVLPIVIVIVILSLIPPFLEYRKHKAAQR